LGDASGSIPTLTTKIPSSEVHSPSGVLGHFFGSLVRTLSVSFLPNAFNFHVFPLSLATPSHTLSSLLATPCTRSAMEMHNRAKMSPTRSSALVSKQTLFHA